MDGMGQHPIDGGEVDRDRCMAGIRAEEFDEGAAADVNVQPPTVGLVEVAPIVVG